jgi:peptidoglycan/LPS O-acetylase OafA/YrhL
MRMVAVLVVAVALVIGIVPQFTHCKTGSTMSATGSSTPASGVSTTAAGAATTAKAAPMRCYWSARAELGGALPLAAAGVLLFLSRRKETRRALAILVSVLGVVTMLVPTVLIGVCEQSSAVCNTTMRPAMLAAGGLTVVLGLIILIRNELGNDPRAEKQPAAMQPMSSSRFA